MTAELRQLVRDAADLTGAAPPDVLAPDAPTLAVADAAASDDFYLVGLIGGKDVGKSAMVNALAGRDVTLTTSHGPGTEDVIAYVHASRAAAVTALLDREAAGRYRVVPHDDPALARQVLLDLPDFDSHFEHHPLLTRRVLRHMLYPVWIVSVEKYADRQPRRMLEQVAAGNAPDNFVFVLNKVDQLGDDDAAAAEIRDDYARRVGQVLNVPPPRVWMVSALRPGRYDLPELKATLARDRSATVVQQSLALASGRQDRTLVAWLDAQDLPARAERYARLRRDAEEAVAARVAGPVLERSVAAIETDPAYVAALAEDALAARVRRWPLVNLVHTLLGPVLAGAGTIVRGRPALTGARPEDVIDANLAPGGEPVAGLVRATFAHLRQTHPPLAALYDGRRLWDDYAADAAARSLRSSLAAALARQRQDVLDRAARGTAALAPIRWLLTIGALLWFPFVQPVLEVVLAPGYDRKVQDAAWLAVRVLGTTYLLQSVAFLSIWFVVLWLALRWNTQRRVARLLARRGGEADLAAVTVRWADDLLAPLKAGHDRVASVADRATAARRAVLTNA